MKKLTLVEENGPRAGQEYALETGELTLGRDEACRIRFEPGEGGVSRRHAVVKAELGGFRLIDQRSANGSFVNQERVDGAWLNDGDLVELGAGGPRLRVRVEGEAAGAAVTAEQPVVAATQSRRALLAESTLFDPARHAPRGGAKPQAGTGLLGIAVILLLTAGGVGLGLLAALMTVFELGPGVALAGVIVAFLPVPVYLGIWLWLDRYDPEPSWALGGAFLWGAGAATFVSAIINTVFGQVVKEATGNAGLANFLSASISAPFVEEAAKGLAVLLIYLALRRQFDGVLDGIVYAGVVALGFAAVENVLYYGRSLREGGAGQMAFVFFLRGILGPFGHAVYTSMTGIGCGIARQSHNTLVRLVAPVVGYFAAVFLHSLWNTMAGLAGGIGAFLLLYLVVWAPLFLVFFGVVIWMGARESALIRRMLTPEVALGLVTQEQADIVASWPKRMGWLMGGLRDFKLLGARRRFLYSATRLALSYWHAERAANAGGETLSVGLVPVFRSEVARLKSQV